VARAAPLTTIQPPLRIKRTGREKREALEAFLFLSPWIIGFLLFMAGPIFASLALSFCKWDVITPIQFVGLTNYRRMTSDPLIVKSLINTLVYAAMIIPGSNIAALCMAMLLNQKLAGIRIFRTIFYLPTLTQGVATYVLWSVVFEPETGILNRTLRKLFWDNPPAWLQDPRYSKLALAIMGVWGVGGMMLIYLAGLNNVPRDLYEAAEIDGAGKLGRFFNVTLPMISPTILFNVIVSTIGSFQVFTAALVLTQGGPSNSTLFYVYYLFRCAFEQFKMGYASAMAWLLFVIVLILTSIQLWASKKWVHYA